MHVNWRASPLHAAVVGLSNSIIQLIVSFGVRISDSQNVAITTTTNAVLVLLSVAVITATNGHE